MLERFRTVWCKVDSKIPLYSDNTCYCDPKIPRRESKLRGLVQNSFRIRFGFAALVDDEFRIFFFRTQILNQNGSKLVSYWYVGINLISRFSCIFSFWGFVHLKWSIFDLFSFTLFEQKTFCSPELSKSEQYTVAYYDLK